jgi:hypothetical protein
MREKTGTGLQVWLQISGSVPVTFISLVRAGADDKGWMRATSRVWASCDFYKRSDRLWDHSRCNPLPSLLLSTVECGKFQQVFYYCRVLL